MHWIFALLTIGPLIGCGRSEEPPQPAPAPRTASADALQRDARVVLVTLDGVRWQEVFDTSASFASERPLMPWLWGELAPSGAIFGDRGAGSPVEVNSLIPKSLPSYQSMMVGRTWDCETNGCDAPDEPTVLESVRQRLGLPREDVAAFASWVGLYNAIASDPSQIIVDIATDDSPSGPPWPDARWDEETFSRALYYLERQKPRLLYIGLLDPDERAHAGDKPGYLQAIRDSDDRLRRLDAALESAGVREDTTVLITTDHGRGAGPVIWKHHSKLDSARGVWLAASGPWVQPVGRAERAGALSLGDLRPTIERLFGLEPSPCEGAGCGAPIPWIAPEFAEASPEEPADP